MRIVVYRIVIIDDNAKMADKYFGIRFELYKMRDEKKSRKTETGLI